MARTRPYSLRRRLLLWLLVPLVTLGLIALVDTYREAVDTANAVSDRVLAGSALAIAERVVVAEDGALEVDIPYVALEMLTSAAQDRVFYRVDGPDGFITGYQTLPVIDGLELEESGYEDASFRGEPMLLSEMIRNLIENVLAYAGNGAEATVKVIDGGTEVVLEVEDTGPGIPASELESVRQRFVRGREGDKPGAGLGLPIVEEIASLFSGQLELLAGADGRGLRVRVAFGKAEA